MCSCSGSCNCNSTTIPRGPQGAPGPTGNAATIAVGSVTALPAGSTPTVSNGGSSSAAVFNFGIPAGATGGNGDNGLNAFTTLTEDFVQPNVGSTRTIYVEDATWVAIDSIIFVERNAITDAGGYYKVISASTISSTITVENLGWTTVGISYVAPGFTVGAVGTLVVAAGTIGADGVPGADGAPGTAIVNALWGNYPGNGGTSDVKTSIKVAGDLLFTDDDALECQTVFRMQDATLLDIRSFIIKLSPSNGTAGTIAIQFEIPVSIPMDNIVTVHMNYKIQRINNTTFRSKGECFVSQYGEVENLFINSIEYSYVCTSTSTLTLNSSTNWGDDQWVVVIVNDEDIPIVSVIHHEVKVVKKSV